MLGGKRSKMGKLAHEAAEEVNEILADEEAILLARTRIDLESLRPQISDKQAYDRLIPVVRESIRKNESIAQLKARILALGKEVQKVAKEVIPLIPKN